MSDYDEYLYQWAGSYKRTVCECGGDIAKVGTYGHATWCPVYVPPPPVTDKCECGPGPWHSVDCRFRVWPQEPVDELKQLQNKLKKAVDELNKPSYNIKKWR